ncbi:hypothetical protein [Psychrobacillus sp. NPDC096389]|uniref:hypothetical protein n=1 Tax=Psychrobacillus sp. NPDC096389 TaxID=3364490 RepID=UPI00380EF3A8
MPEIKTDDLIYFENGLFLPMLIKVLEKDLRSFEKLPFKLDRPYKAKVEKALKSIRKDLKAADIFLVRNNMKVVKWEASTDSTTYAFISQGTEDHRKFLNADIKMKCEELLSVYLAK